MKKYESVILVNPSVDDEGMKALISKLTDVINSNGKIEKVEELGKKKLAYEINKCSEAYYVVLNFEIEPSKVSELERVYRITDEVMKFVVIKKDEE